MVQLSLMFIALTVLTVQASPILENRDFSKLANGQAAQKLNAEFATLTASSSCTGDQPACVNGEFAQCSNDKFAITSCSPGLTCHALPLVNKPGTTVACTTQEDALARIKASGATGGISG